MLVLRSSAVVQRGEQPSGTLGQTSAQLVVGVHGVDGPAAPVQEQGDWEGAVLASVQPETPCSVRRRKRDVFHALQRARCTLCNQRGPHALARLIHWKSGEVRLRRRSDRVEDELCLGVQSGFHAVGLSVRSSSVLDADAAAVMAVADLHVEADENRRFVERLRPAHDGDWLVVCGDVGEAMSDIEWALATLTRRFEKVIWVPGNHELWTTPADPVQVRGDARYRYIVRYCRDLGIATPEDPYPVWSGPGGPVVVAPLFTLYDYSFGVNVAPTKHEALARAHNAGVVCSDELVLHADPYASRDQWCHERVRLTEERLTA